MPSTDFKARYQCVGEMKIIRHPVKLTKPFFEEEFTRSEESEVNKEPTGS